MCTTSYLLNLLSIKSSQVSVILLDSAILNSWNSLAISFYCSNIVILRLVNYFFNFSQSSYKIYFFSNSISNYVNYPLFAFKLNTSSNLAIHSLTFWLSVTYSLIFFSNFSTFGMNTFVNFSILSIFVKLSSFNYNLLTVSFLAKPLSRIMASY